MTRHDFDNSGDDTPVVLDPLPGPLHERPKVRLDEARAMLAAAVLGMELGDYDRRILAYLASDDYPTVAAIASSIHRARQEDPR
jgi:hypothetical protein